MAAQKPSGNSDKKFFDVAKPGKSIPPATSRPAIVGHRTLLKDPMMVSGAEPTGEEMLAPAETPKPEKIVSTTAPTLKPINLTEEPAAKVKVMTTEPAVIGADQAETTEQSPAPEIKAEQGVPDEATVEDALATPETDPPAEVSETAPAEKPAPATNEKASSGESKPAESSESLTGSSEATAEAESMVAKNDAEKQAAKAAEEAAARVEAAEKLIAERTYFVPVGEHRRARSKKHTGLLVFGCILALAALGYLAIDSGMIETSIELPVRLFRVE